MLSSISSSLSKYISRASSTSASSSSSSLSSSSSTSTSAASSPTIQPSTASTATSNSKSTSNSTPPQIQHTSTTQPLPLTLSPPLPPQHPHTHTHSHPGPPLRNSGPSAQLSSSCASIDVDTSLSGSVATDTCLVAPAPISVLATIPMTIASVEDLRSPKMVILASPALPLSTSNSATAPASAAPSQPQSWKPRQTKASKMRAQRSQQQKSGTAGAKKGSLPSAASFDGVQQLQQMSQTQSAGSSGNPTPRKTTGSEADLSEATAAKVSAAAALASGLASVSIRDRKSVPSPFRPKAEKDKEREKEKEKDKGNAAANSASSLSASQASRALKAFRGQVLSNKEKEKDKLLPNESGAMPDSALAASAPVASAIAPPNSSSSASPSSGTALSVSGTARTRPPPAPKRVGFTAAPSAATHRRKPRSNTLRNPIRIHDNKVSAMKTDERTNEDKNAQDTSSSGSTASSNTAQHAAGVSERENKLNEGKGLKQRVSDDAGKANLSANGNIARNASAQGNESSSGVHPLVSEEKEKPPSGPSSASSSLSGKNSATLKSLLLHSSFPRKIGRRQPPVPYSNSTLEDSFGLIEKVEEYLRCVKMNKDSIIKFLGKIKTIHSICYQDRENKWSAGTLTRKNVKAKESNPAHRTNTKEPPSQKEEKLTTPVIADDSEPFDEKVESNFGSHSAHRAHSHHSLSLSKGSTSVSEDEDIFDNIDELTLERRFQRYQRKAARRESQYRKPKNPNMNPSLVPDGIVFVKGKWVVAASLSNSAKGYLPPSGGIRIGATPELREPNADFSESNYDDSESQLDGDVEENDDRPQDLDDVPDFDVEPRIIKTLSSNSTSVINAHGHHDDASSSDSSLSQSKGSSQVVTHLDSESDMTSPSQSPHAVNRAGGVPSVLLQPDKKQLFVNTLATPHPFHTIRGSDLDDDDWDDEREEIKILQSGKSANLNSTLSVASKIGSTSNESAFALLAKKKHDLADENALDGLDDFDEDQPTKPNPIATLPLRSSQPPIEPLPAVLFAPKPVPALAVGSAATVEQRNVGVSASGENGNVKGVTLITSSMMANLGVDGVLAVQSGGSMKKIDKDQKSDYPDSLDDLDDLDDDKRPKPKAKLSDKHAAIKRFSGSLPKPVSAGMLSARSSNLLQVEEAEDVDVEVDESAAQHRRLTAAAEYPDNLDDLIDDTRPVLSPISPKALDASSMAGPAGRQLNEFDLSDGLQTSWRASSVRHSQWTAQLAASPSASSGRSINTPNANARSLGTLDLLVGSVLTTAHRTIPFSPEFRQINTSFIFDIGKLISAPDKR